MNAEKVIQELKEIKSEIGVWVIDTKGNDVLHLDDSEKRRMEALDIAIEALSKDRLIHAFAENLTYEEITKGEEYAKGYADGLKEQLNQCANNTDIDLVSREAALGELRQLKKVFDAISFTEAICKIRQLPSLSPRRPNSTPTAYWIWCGDKGDSRFMCSRCRCKEDVPTCNGEPDIWDFCPNCGARIVGARMRGEDE